MRAATFRFGRLMGVAGNARKEIKEMKSLFQSALLTATITLFSAAAVAQSVSRMRVNVPFSFIAGEQNYAAGEYVVQVNADHHILSLRPVDDAITRPMLLGWSSVKRTASVPLERGFLLFAVYPDQKVLRGVCAPGAEAGYKLPVSPREKELAKNNSKPAIRVVL